MNSKRHYPNARWFSKTLTIMLTVIGLTGLKSSALERGITKRDMVNFPPDTTLKLVAGVPLNPKDVSPLLIGETIPTVTLQDAEGKNLSLNMAIAEKQTILIFYRGGWCPYCNKQLAGLQEIEKDLKSLGYQIIAISTDSPENLNKTTDKQQLSYKLLSDADLAVAKQFGIAYKGPKSYDKFLPETSGGKNVDKLLPVPSVFILNKKGMIQFEYINPNIGERISADLLKAAASALQEKI